MKKNAESPSPAPSQAAPAAKTYLRGFGNHFESEAEPGALPKGQNSPQQVAFGLYAEQLSGSSFTAPQSENLRTWFYRIRPSVIHSSSFRRVSPGNWRSRPFQEVEASPNQLRWNPFPLPDTPTDFVEGVKTIAGNGDSASWRGSAVHLFACNKSMTNRFMYNADGEFLFVPQLGSVTLRTEFGDMDLRPGEIAVIPRGVKFAVDCAETVRGYICENYGLPLRLPSLGVIGSNGLANARDFLTPTAKYEKQDGELELIAKYNGRLWSASIAHSPLDVVAWHGNYVPYKYDLKNFQVINSVSFDHSDPSIFTVLTAPSEMAGFANVDFVIFPPRWAVAEHTFRPPYFHRNVMSEYMGLIFGLYEAKEEGFVPGGGSLHNCMSPHGPDTNTFDKASTMPLKPAFIGDTLAFMFESSLPYIPTELAINCEQLQKNYIDCWSGLKGNFDK